MSCPFPSTGPGHLCVVGAGLRMAYMISAVVYHYIQPYNGNVSFTEIRMMYSILVSFLNYTGLYLVVMRGGEFLPGDPINK